MAPRFSISRAGAVLRAELASIRRHEPDVDPGEIAGFTLPLLVRVVGIAAIGVVPLLVVRNGSHENSELVPIIGSLALVLICAAVVSWLLSVVISGLVVMVLYQTRPAASSKLVSRILVESFMRVDDIVSALMLLALVAGLVSLAFGLPAHAADEHANPVIDELLTAQIGVFIVALGVMFVAESIRSAADIVDDQSLMLAWPWALVIACLSWVLATFAGPFEATRMLTLLLQDWLPSNIDGVSRAEVIRHLLPPGARWWVAFGPLPVITGIWAYQAWRLDGFTHLRGFLAEESPPGLV